jgi:hypothetical protein
MPKPEDLRRPVGRRNLVFNNIVEVLFNCLRSHSLILKTPVIDDYTGLVGLEEFKDFMIIISLYEWQINFPGMEIIPALHRTTRNVLKSNAIYLEASE